MKMHITDEKTGIGYTLHGDYYLPDLQLPEENETPIGSWGQRYLRYIREHRKVFFTNLLTSGRLADYLTEIDRQAEEMYWRLIRQYAECDGITEQLKADDQMEWVRQMNNIKSAVTEVINHDLIFV